MGKGATAAAAEGAGEVAAPVLAGAVTTLVVFVPAIFLSGMIKFLFVPLALAAGITIGASYFIAMGVVPPFCARFLGKIYEGGERQRQGEALKSRFEEAFSGRLRKVMQKGVVAVVAMVGATAAVFLLLPALGSELFPDVDAGTSLDIDFARAIFEPLAAKQRRLATVAASDAGEARVMLLVSQAYYQLLRAQQSVAISREAKSEADKLANVTKNFADSGEGLVADAERAAVESLLMADVIEEARLNMMKASAALARLLRLDEALRLEAVDGLVVPLSLVQVKADGEAELLAGALAHRPELRENRALVEAARAALKQGQYGPFIPKLQAAYSYGDFGGGGSPRNSGDRHDVGVALYWQLDGLGLLNRNLAKQCASQLRKSQLREQQAMSDIVSEVRSAHAALVSAQRRMTITRSAVARARRAHELNRERIFENEGLPLESLTAMQALARAEELNLRAVTDYNLAQLRTFVAIGGDLRPEEKTDPGAGK